MILSVGSQVQVQVQVQAGVRILEDSRVVLSHHITPSPGVFILRHLLREIVRLAMRSDNMCRRRVDGTLCWARQLMKVMWEAVHVMLNVEKRK